MSVAPAEKETGADGVTASRSDSAQLDKLQKEPINEGTLRPTQAPDPPLAVTRLLDKLPPWISTNLRSKQSWKILARCWLASWVSFVIILPDRSLRSLGNAAFFAVLSSLILPPNMPVQMFIFAIATMIVGMLLGWGIGAAAMKAAIAARDQVVLKQSILQAQQSVAGAANPDAEFRLEIFEGLFLDARSSVVYGVFLAVAAFFFALVRAYLPALALFSIFGTVVVDIFCSFGPLFPVLQYTIVSSLLISVACYTAIGVVCIIFVFPETMNHSYMALVTSMLGDMKAYLDLQGQVLEHTSEQIVADQNGVVAKSAGIRLGLLTAMQALQQKAGLINAEFSWGRWNGDDVKGLEEPLRMLTSRMSGFQSVTKLLEPMKITILAESSTVDDSDSSTASSRIHSIDLSGDTELIRQLVSRHHALEAQHSLRVVDIVPLVRASSEELRTACANALLAAQSVFEEINTFRWHRGSADLAQREARLDEAADALRAAVESFMNEKRLAVLQPFVPMLESLNPQQVERRGLPIRSLIIASVFAAQMVVTADAIVDLLELVRSTSRKRRKSRLWAPGGLRALGKFLLRRDRGDPTEKRLGEDVPPEIVTEEEKEEVPYRLDPDSRPPSNLIQKIMNAIHGVYMWLKSAEGLFVIKYVVVTIALWIPSVLRSSANFSYVQKGVWALIMAQTTLNIYVSDQIYNYVTRIFGTFMGAVVGLAAWYIGNGHSNGSPYGIATAMGVILVPVVFLRAFAPPSELIPIVMFSVTFALIVGYSWIDGHLFVVGNPGIGWTIAWKRFVLVVVGCAASFILMLIPPISGRKAVRMRNATIITELSSLYAFLMSTWIAEEAPLSKTSTTAPDASPDADADADAEAADGKGLAAAKAPPKWSASFRTRLLALAEQVRGLQEQTQIARWEGNIRGAWPVAEYEELVQKEVDMLAALAQLGGALYHLDPAWRLTLNRRTKILNPNFVTDVMSTFALVSQSLRTSEPMHQILPTSLLDRLLYHHRHGHDRGEAKRELDKVDYVGKMKSPEFMFFATGVAAVSQIITHLDEMHRITKRLCGEVPFKGFDKWKSEYNRMYEGS